VIRMRKRDKAVIGFSLVVLFAGFVFLSSTQVALTKGSDDRGVENGVDYSVEGGELPENQSLSRYFVANESLSVLFNDALKPPVPVDVPVDFLIFSPSGKLCNLTYWVLSRANPDTSLTAPPLIVWIAAFDIGQIEGMTLDNSSFPQFVGKVSEDGNYTLVYKGGLPPYTAIRSMTLSKVTWRVDYPYSSMMPIGSILLVVGVVLSLAAVWDSRRRTRRRLSS